MIQPILKQFSFCLFVFLELSCSAQKINGLSFVAGPNRINSSHVIPVKRVHANFVALMPFAFVKGIHAPQVIYQPNRQWFGETNAGIRQYAGEFRKQGIQVMIKPQLWVNKGAFTGFIEMKSEADWKVFEADYSKFILNFVQLAAQIDAPVFCIGTELKRFVRQRPLFWKQLIQKIRRIYKGKLTYAANWDEFPTVPFWNELDYIGIDAYFPLHDAKTPTVEQLEKGWQPHKGTMVKLSKKVNKQILFTEYGYRSVDYTGKKPWDASRIETGVNLTAQVHATEALFRQFWSEDWFAGGFVWKWFSDYETSGGKENNRFTPQNKPVETVIRRQYAE